MRETLEPQGVSVGSEGEQGESRYVQLMGADLGPTFEVLSNDLALIYANWEVYGALFADSEHMHLLMQAAGALSALLRDALLFDVVLQLARIADKPSTSGKANLTLQCLPELVGATPDDTAFQARVGTLVREACTACKFAVNLRHKRIAHRDRDVALRTAEAPPLEFEFCDIDNALRACAALLNEVEARFCCGATTAYEFVGVGQPDSLFYFLRRGIDAADADAGL